MNEHHKLVPVSGEHTVAFRNNVNRRVSARASGARIIQLSRKTEKWRDDGHH
jgi:hypothetical protein